MDNTFGPVLPDHFDFTLLFERSMLGMVPAGIAILIVPVYLRAMARAANQVRPGRLLWAKLATAAALVGIQLASIILWHNAGLLRSDVALAASITSLVASLGIAIILYIAHTFFLCPSAFLSVYFSLTMVFDVTMARSYFLRHSIDALGGLQVTVAGLKLVLVLLEEVPKRQLFRSNLLRPGLGEDEIVIDGAKTPEHAHSKPSRARFQPCCKSRAFLMYARRVPRIESGNRVQPQSDIFHGTCEDPDVVLAPGAAERPMPADDAEGRFEAGDPTIRCRPAHR